MSGVLAPAGTGTDALERLRGRIVVVEFGGHARVNEATSARSPTMSWSCAGPG